MLQLLSFLAEMGRPRALLKKERTERQSQLNPASPSPAGICFFLLLPTECIIRVLSFLDGRFLLNFVKTCRRNRDIVYRTLPREINRLFFTKIIFNGVFISFSPPRKPDYLTVLSKGAEHDGVLVAGERPYNVNEPALEHLHRLREALVRWNFEHGSRKFFRDNVLRTELETALPVIL